MSLPKEKDVYFYNGDMMRGADLGFIELVDRSKAADECLIFLTTPGGDPNAAFKIARYLQHKYTKVEVGIAGLCKSAGTLLAIGAHELVFTPYGELGPLDVQLAKRDHLAEMESGLNISEAFFTLEDRARKTYQNLILEIINASGGVVTFQTASKAAAEIISAMYGPVFGKIDPEEVGSRTRAMRIGVDYGKRLNANSQNLKEQALNALAESYSSHGFVIDFEEAKLLFSRVRLANDTEAGIVSELGQLARYPQRSLVMDYHGKITMEDFESEQSSSGSIEVENPRASDIRPNGGNFETPNGSECAPPRADGAAKN